MKNQLSDQESQELLQVLKQRFERQSPILGELKWADVEEKLHQHPAKLWSLSEMERTGGEPALVAYDSDKDQFIFCDCVKESPKERRSICYDQKALESRKKFKPATSAEQMAIEMGIELLTEEQYHYLQKLGPVDTKTSSWLKTPEDVRDRGGAIFGDYRFGRVFVYHNGAESYYGSRGFRGVLRV